MMIPLRADCLALGLNATGDLPVPGETGVKRDGRVGFYLLAPGLIYSYYLQICRDGV